MFRVYKKIWKYNWNNDVYIEPKKLTQRRTHNLKNKNISKNLILLKDFSNIFLPGRWNLKPWKLNKTKHKIQSNLIVEHYRF